MKNQRNPCFELQKLLSSCLDLPPEMTLIDRGRVHPKLAFSEHSSKFVPKLKMRRNLENLFQKILSHHSGHVIFERVLPFLSDFELLELEKELGEREDLLEGLNAALPSIVWRLRAKKDPKGKEKQAKRGAY